MVALTAQAGNHIHFINAFIWQAAVLNYGPLKDETLNPYQEIYSKFIIEDPKKLLEPAIIKSFSDDYDLEAVIKKITSMIKERIGRIFKENGFFGRDLAKTSKEEFEKATSALSPLKTRLSEDSEDSQSTDENPPLMLLSVIEEETSRLIKEDELETIDAILRPYVLHYLSKNKFLKETPLKIEKKFETHKVHVYAPYYSLTSSAYSKVAPWEFSYVFSSKTSTFLTLENYVNNLEEKELLELLLPLLKDQGIETNSLTLLWALRKDSTRALEDCNEINLAFAIKLKAKKCSEWIIRNLIYEFGEKEMGIMPLDEDWSSVRKAIVETSNDGGFTILREAIRQSKSDLALAFINVMKFDETDEALEMVIAEARKLDVRIADNIQEKVTSDQKNLSENQKKLDNMLICGDETAALGLIEKRTDSVFSP